MGVHRGATESLVVGVRPSPGSLGAVLQAAEGLGAERSSVGVISRSNVGAAGWRPQRGRDLGRAGVTGTMEDRGRWPFLRVPRLRGTTGNNMEKAKTEEPRRAGCCGPGGKGLRPRVGIQGWQGPGKGL